MEAGDAVMMLTVIEDRARRAKVAIVEAGMLKQQASTPRLVLNGHQGPSPTQIAAQAQQVQHMAGLLIADVIRFSAELGNRSKANEPHANDAGAGGPDQG